MNSSQQNLNLVPCRICGRSFESSSLERHEPICSKVVTKKKRVFNSYKQRAAGTGVSSVRGPSATKQKPASVSHWKQQHEDFINTIRSARLATDAVKKGLPLPPPPPASVNPDYIECPYCNRRFNDTAADRHINFCRTNVNRKVVSKQAPQPAPSFQPRAPPPMAQVQLASKQPRPTAKVPAVPSTSFQPPRGPPVQPPVRTSQAVFSHPTTYSPPSAVGSQLSRGKLTAAAQAVMGIYSGKACAFRTHADIPITAS
ncbi:zinc finger C2HC domain-containing protein 1B-like isoform X1 [Scyliorhinus canicula]|uniref:zinc finger C2HC domain-containing protein 1B-like isoform X1 n=1 Tax=Scyliorhinus canicula TaxID=7830 RepID=UPI0018F3310E|nr:zinc finger C2HC domain-containing protein 1B-like isoform X1 [Scyliorhinus canicula]